MGEMWSEGTKLKVAAVLQQLAGMGTAFGYNIAPLREWGEANQQTVANIARYYEQKRQEKLAKDAEKKQLWGKILTGIGTVAGAGIGGVPGLAVSALGGIAGSAVSGGSVDPMSYMKALPTGTDTLDTTNKSGTQNTMSSLVSSIYDNKVSDKAVGVLVKSGGKYWLVDPQLGVILSLFEDEDNNKTTVSQPLSMITLEGRQ